MDNERQPVNQLLESAGVSPTTDTDAHTGPQGRVVESAETTAARFSARQSSFWRWSGHATPLQRHAAFFLAVFLLIALTLSVLQSRSGALQESANTPPARTAS